MAETNLPKQPQKHVALYGPPGAGKSTVISCAETLGWHAVDLEDTGSTLEERENTLRLLTRTESNWTLFGAADVPPELFPEGTKFALLLPDEDVLTGRVQQRNDTRAHKWIEHAKKVRNEHLQMANQDVFDLVITEDVDPEDIVRKISNHLL